MDRNVFPTKEAGDYMNDRVVFIINDIAKVDNEEQRKVFEKYNARVLPTFLLFNGDGVEVSRFSGGVNDVKSFIALIEKQLKPENYSPALEKRYKENPSYAFEYISHLREIGKFDEANKCLEESFPKISDEERFSEKWITFYKYSISEIDIVNSSIFKYIYENPKKVAAIMGNENYTVFMKEKANGTLLSTLFSRDRKVIDPLLATIKENSVMKTGFTKFIESNIDAALSGDVSSLINAANKTVKKSGSNTTGEIVNYIRALTYENEDKSEVMTFMENVIRYEKDIILRQNYLEQMDRMMMENKTK